MEENKNRKTRKGVGRKPKTDPAVYRYVVRLNSEENVKFDIQFQKSGLRERSKFIKAMIFGKEIKVVRIDKATMDYYVRLTNFYHQFQAIGNNYNLLVVQTFSKSRQLAGARLGLAMGSASDTMTSATTQ